MSVASGRWLPGWLFAALACGAAEAGTVVYSTSASGPCGGVTAPRVMRD